MWHSLGKWVIRNRFLLLGFLVAVTVIMVRLGSHIQLNYEFAKAIPANHPKYTEYMQFKKNFGEDGNLLVIGIRSEKITEREVFNDYAALSRNIRAVPGVEDVLSVPFSINLVKNPLSEKLTAVRIFDSAYANQSQLDDDFRVFYNLPFYRGLLYNPQTHAWLIAVRINKEILNSAGRTKVVDNIGYAVDSFDEKQNLRSALSGLPLVRTALSTRIANEMKLFLFGSALLSAFILLLFFRSFSATLLSIAVVGTGVIWGLGTMVLLGYKITLLTALIPPLLVVIGIPNCIYFLNKFHFEYRLRGNKNEAITNMVGRMGIVTLFCNIAAAIGFAVFALTRSIILKEFGVVAGINIMMLFVVSFILIPTILSLLPPPKERHTRYIENERLNRWLMRIEKWVFNHKKIIYGATALLIFISVTGILQLKSVGYIVDDLPKSDQIYTDLKFFEKNFNGVMPLEILVDTEKKYGVSNLLSNLQRIDSLVQFIAFKPEFAKPLSVTEGLKFARQAYYDEDSNSYALPNNFDIAFLSPYLRMKGDTTSKNNNFGRLVSSFMDSNRQIARISVNMADVGSVQLPLILDTLQKRSSEIFDSSKYHVQFTGTSVIFLEGSRFIINGLKESIFWAFLLIAFCMLYLFRSVRILVCSLIPNIIPLAFTAGIMGWTGIPLKPSTVLIFSVALGIAIDVTIRFLVNYKQELPANNYSVEDTVQQTIRHTGISIIYTSLVLIAGFVIFCFSNFGGTQSLGWLTSLTLLIAMVTNLVLLPVLLLILKGEKNMN